ncbi:hypothetical protein VNO77_17134 [Canavalia gladiata]|uniref:Uncharacterized protein n=1 Tax=Canavalia gladiata TaxID=3824 RepID=A0AAN9QMF5_CANGL
MELIVQTSSMRVVPFASSPRKGNPKRETTFEDSVNQISTRFDSIQHSLLTSQTKSNLNPQNIHKPLSSIPFQSNPIHSIFSVCVFVAFLCA